MEKHITLQNNIAELNTLAMAIEEFAQQAKIGMKLQFNLGLVLDELVTNIVNYAYDDNQTHQINITLSCDDEKLKASLTDDGKAFNPVKMPMPDIKSGIEERKIGGLGVYFAKMLMDKMEYNRQDGFNRLCLEKKLVD